MTLNRATPVFAPISTIDGSVADAMASMTGSNSLRDAAPPVLSMSSRSGES
jgi:hypothetical protein